LALGRFSKVVPLHLKLLNCDAGDGAAGGKHSREKDTDQWVLAELVPSLDKKQRQYR
jgi:hypothetical protein